MSNIIDMAMAVDIATVFFFMFLTFKTKKLNRKLIEMEKDLESAILNGPAARKALKLKMKARDDR